MDQLEYQPSIHTSSIASSKNQSLTYVQIYWTVQKYLQFKIMDEYKSAQINIR